MSRNTERRFNYGASDTIHVPFSITIWPGGNWREATYEGLWLDINFLKWFISFRFWDGEEIR